jgi:putative nucleotide binding protein
MDGEQRREGLEEYAVVLDFLVTGKSFSVNPEPLSQLIGEERFTLLEVLLKPGASVKISERVYIGKADRDKISLIKTRLSYMELTESARNELPIAVSEIVKRNESRFVSVFNKAGPLNIREHSLELLPGVGKKHLQYILKAREEKEFESFADISARVPLLQDPIKLITERVLRELKEESRFYLLTRPYSRRQ